MVPQNSADRVVLRRTWSARQPLRTMLLLRGRSAAPASSPCAVHRVLRAALPHSGAGATPEPASAPQHHSPAVFSPAYVEARLRVGSGAAEPASLVAAGPPPDPV